jgi:hypothetical protein
MKPATPQGYTNVPPSQQHPATRPDRWAEVERRLKGRGLIVSHTLLPKVGWQTTVNIALATPADALNGAITSAPRLTDADFDLIIRRLDAEKKKLAKKAAPAKTPAKAAAKKTAAKGGPKKGTTDAKVARILKAIEGANTPGQLGTVEHHYKLGDLPRFSKSDAQRIGKALAARRKVLGAAKKGARRR